MVLRHLHLGVLVNPLAQSSATHYSVLVIGAICQYGRGGMHHLCLKMLSFNETVSGPFDLLLRLRFRHQDKQKVAFCSPLFSSPPLPFPSSLDSFSHIFAPVSAPPTDHLLTLPLPVF